MSSLFNYIKELDEIIFEATDEDGVVDFEKIQERMDELQLSIEEKVDNTISFIKSRKATAEALKTEKLAIGKRQQQAEREAQRCTEYLTYCLKGAKWESTAGKVSYRKSEKVVITDPLKIPEELTVVDIVPDKTQIKRAFKNGQEVPGATLEENINTIIK